MQTDSLLPEDTKVRSLKYLNNVIEQDHSHIKSRECDARFQTVQERRDHDFRHRVAHRIRKGQLDLAKLGLKDVAAAAVWNAALSTR